MFTPQCFVTVGQTGAMFTLRETYLHEFCISGRRYTEVRSFHIQNLGTTPDESFAKAGELARGRGLELTTTRERLDEELRAIHRTTPDEMAARAEAARLVSIEHNKRMAEQRDYWRMEHLTRCGDTASHYRSPTKAREWFVTDYIGATEDSPARRVRIYQRQPHWSVWMPYGKYEGRTLDEIGAVDRPYLAYLAEQDQYRTDLDELRTLRIRAWLESHPAAPELNEYIGTVGERLVFDLCIRNVRRIDSGESYGYGRPAPRKLLIKAADPQGRAVTIWYSGHAWRPTLGDACKVKGTIKRHAEYRGVRETTLSRAALVDEAGLAKKPQAKKKQRAA